MADINKTLCHYQVTCDEQCFAELVDQLYPLVSSVTNKYLVDKANHEDVIQDAFIKLAQHAQNINTNLKAWIAVTARNIAISYNRKAQSQRQRIQHLATMPEESIAWDAIYTRLDIALEQLTDEERTLILSHFLQHQTLSAIASQRSCSVATISRRLAAASKKLRNVFRGLNLNTLDEICTDALFTHAILNYTPAPTYRTTDYDPNTPTINVGVYISQFSLETPENYHFKQIYLSTWFQLYNTTFLKNCSNVRIIGLIEPGSIKCPQIEATLREREFTGGYMDITNTENLKTLDVIFVSTNYATPNAVLDSIYDAVHSGVGFFSESRIGSRIPGYHSPRLHRLMLAQKCFGFHHVPGAGIQCCQPCPATVRKKHPILKGLQPGDSITAIGCGTIFIPKPDAQLIVEKNLLASSYNNKFPIDRPIRCPAIVSGHIGKGRTVICNMTNISHMNNHPKIQGNFLANCINWLAEPRLKQKQSSLTVHQ
ncbi:RNA polymerase sigma factor SigX [Poriferisphaera corsica]|uniref:RNA polymerase sigma factor SigX n=1 Tax=Poriferisphaera corsica TaxID=2528020 RepID=A0A517YTH0_9BACT|nr:sigma-70 family RNA polymerase sigma factor [Poriferisphaera corsica]QDU33514.1 RNA polymerase sigma factor SigX [Poriferisphaera corsica]